MTWQIPPSRGTGSKTYVVSDDPSRLCSVRLAVALACKVTCWRWLCQGWSPSKGEGIRQLPADIFFGRWPVFGVGLVGFLGLSQALDVWTFMIGLYMICFFWMYILFDLLHHFLLEHFIKKENPMWGETALRGGTTNTTNISTMQPQMVGNYHFHPF